LTITVTGFYNLQIFTDNSSITILYILKSWTSWFRQLQFQHPTNNL